MTEVKDPFLRVATLKKWHTFPKFQEISSDEFVAVDVAPSEESATFPVLGRQTLLQDGRCSEFHLSSMDFIENCKARASDFGHERFGARP
jgi:hypothetical protein